MLTFRDYLLHIVGPDILAKQLAAYPGYDEEVDPSISNVFATAAYRFAHLMVQPFIFRLDEQYKEHKKFPSPLLSKAFFAPWRVIFEGMAKNCSLLVLLKHIIQLIEIKLIHLLISSGGLDPIVRGLVGKPAKLNTQDHMMPDELREKLFKFTMDLALDLGALNMQRGRDHGLPGTSSAFYEFFVFRMNSTEMSSFCSSHYKSDIQSIAIFFTPCFSFFRLQQMAQILRAVRTTKPGAAG